MKRNSDTVAVIGAGPAGLMAAEVLVQGGMRIPPRWWQKLYG